MPVGYVPLWYIKAICAPGCLCVESATIQMQVLSWWEDPR